MDDSIKQPDMDAMSRYPLHWMVWHNEYKRLKGELLSNQSKKEELDPHGCTPLMLAVMLGHLESVQVLLNSGCSVSAINKDGWTVVHEATATGDPEILKCVMESRDRQRASSRLLGIPLLLAKLSEAPDFYVEMKWEFTSWVPLVSRVCPSDTYRVYKKGSNVRIDTTLLSFDENYWQRGSRSYIFQSNMDEATMLEVDHETCQVMQETIHGSDADFAFGDLQPHPSAISNRLSSPIVTTYIDTDKISFERDKSGIWGWRNDRSENVNGHDCKVFSATNVELVAKTRTDHLSEENKLQASSPTVKSPIQSFLTLADETDENNTEGVHCNLESPKLTAEEYFDKKCNSKGYSIGRHREVSSKVQKFKANLWLCETYPLKLQDQVMPIVDLMAISSSHFAKLKEFIQMQLPSGFPVKIEIPLFHILTARITFGNIFGLDELIDGVSVVQEEEKLSCVIDDSVFVPSSSYKRIGTDASAVSRPLAMDEEDALLQFALIQSLKETTGCKEEQIDIWEALETPGRSPTHTSNTSNSSSTPNSQQMPSFEETQLQRAIEESILMSQTNFNYSAHASESNNSDQEVTNDPDLHLALSLSKNIQSQQEQERLEEEEILKRILELSLTDK